MKTVTSRQQICISVIIPVLNEAGYVVQLSQVLSRILAEICRLEYKNENLFEILFVDDGSTDETWNLIAMRHQEDPRIGGLRLSRNFGHHLAITAGLDRACGEAVVLMDGDGQDPPEEIPKLYSRLKEGFDLVYAIRRQRRDPFIKRFNSWLFWCTINYFTGLSMPANQMLLRIMSRKLVDSLLQMRESARFIHGMMAWAGFRVTTVEVQHRERKTGATKYSVPRQLRLALYALASFSTTPLRISSLLGLITAVVAMVFGVVLAAAKILYGYSVEGWASIMISIFFLAGLQFLLMGIMGEYIGKIYKEAQQRPLYLIRDAL